jgi:hypothetical protein
MNSTQRSFLLLLLSWLLPAQDITRSFGAATNSLGTCAFDREIAAKATNGWVSASRFNGMDELGASAKFNLTQGAPAIGGLSFLPQASRSNPSSMPLTPAKPAYWTKRRVAVVSLGLALAGAGAAMWVKGKDIANPNYNLNACGSALLSGGVGTGFNPAGDAAVGMYCNQTIPSTERKAGLVLLVVGGPVSLLGFLLHSH